MIVSLVVFSEIPVTGTTTSIIAVAVFNPSTVVAVIVTVPGVTAYTTPAVSTVATVGFEDVHVTFLFVALVGVTVAINVVVSPTSKLPLG